MFSLWKEVWWCNLLLVCFFGRTEKKIECSSFSIFLPLGSSATRQRGSWGVVVCAHCEGGLLQRTVQQGERTLTLCCVSDSVGVAVRACGVMVSAWCIAEAIFYGSFFFPLSFSEFVFGVCSFLWCALSAMTATSFSNLASIFYVVIYQRSSILRLNGERQHWTIQCFWREEGMFPLVHSVAFCFAVIRSLYVCSFSLYFCLFIKKGYFAKIYIIQQSSEAHMFIWHCFTPDLIFLWSNLGLLVQNE